MRLTKYTHACVRLEHDGRAIVIDPGVWSEPEALDGVTDVLVTHEHFDHIDFDRLTALHKANPDLSVYAPAAVAAHEKAADLREAFVEVAIGDETVVNGFAVRPVGGIHAEIYEGLPGCANAGFLVGHDALDGALYHPGDSLFLPDLPVATLLVPTSAPWLKLSEALDFVRAVGPRRAYSIHDAMLSPVGQQSVDGWIGFKGSTEYARIDIGDSVSL